MCSKYGCKFRGSLFDHGNCQASPSSLSSKAAKRMFELWSWCLQVPTCAEWIECEQGENGDSIFIWKNWFPLTLCVMHRSVTVSLLAMHIKDLNQSNMFALITLYRAKILFPLASTHTWLNFSPFSTSFSCQWPFTSACQSNLTP